MELPKELPSRYDPSLYENDIYSEWEASGDFAPPPVVEGEEKRETFTVAIPPPNVTGVLHMGHALDGTIQDIAVRFKRMSGYDTLWIPGTDHAGIATQAVVEKKIFKETGKTREDMGREAFLAEIWKWKEENGATILNQFKALGCSADWSRTAFTLDPGMVLAVRTAFVRLWNKELVYKGARIVNWDCALKTAVSDDEVEMEPRKGKMWYIRYELADSDEFITVATTRPETLLGDTAVAVHPEDERFKHLVGKDVIVPFVNRRVAIIADDSVDSELGTGCVKVTPGHDLADYERGARHNLPIILLLDKGGTMNENAGPFEGKSRELTRKEIVAQLEEMGQLDRVEDISHSQPISDRSKTVIEPLVSEQWFVKMEDMAKPAIASIDRGSLKFRPERWTKVYLDWLNNVQDWCISRQLWWGHRIPVWYDEDGAPCASVEDLEIGSLHPTTGKPIVSQDPDVLDTWASSWLWPFATLGWPNQTEDLARFYPTQFLATARDIIYLWVARMVMAGHALLEELPEDQRTPFGTCFIHATVLDGKGKRMSKSAGNGIDPLEMIAKYGADAVRFCLISLTREGQDVKLSENRFDDGRRFTNKLWNASRFVCANLAGERGAGTSSEAATFEDRWILSRLAAVREEVTSDLNDHNFNDAVTKLYRFCWNDFCDWYLELAKSRFTAEGGDAKDGEVVRGTLTRVLGDLLKMLHPFMPFQTETLWQVLHDALGAKPERQLMTTAWPMGEGIAGDADAESRMDLLQELVRAVRNIRSVTMVGEKKRLDAIVIAPKAEDRAVLNELKDAACGIGFLATLAIEESAERPPASAVGVAGGLEVFVPLGDDVDMGKLRDALEQRLGKTKNLVEGTERKLGNAKFVERADPEIVEAERARVVELEREVELLERNLAGLSA
jgi:valyl-tRNA synthetase